MKDNNSHQYSKKTKRKKSKQQGNSPGDPLFIY